jgi:hypothetical protein
MGTEEPVEMPRQMESVVSTASSVPLDPLNLMGGLDKRRRLESYRHPIMDKYFNGRFHVGAGPQMP